MPETSAPCSASDTETNLSRGAWLGLFFALLVLCVVERRRSLVTLFLVLVALLVVSPPFYQKVFSIKQFSVGLDAGRLAMWKVAAGMIRDHPFLGMGIGSYMAHSREYAHLLGVSYAHNCYLQIWAECGVFSLVSFLGFLFVLFRNGIKAVMRGKRDILAISLMCALAGFLAHTFIDTQLYSLQMAMLFWVFAGVFQTMTRMSSGRSQT